MDKTPVYPIFLGMLIGAIVGFGAGALTENTIHGIQLGSMLGLFIGWVIAATMKPAS